MKKTIFLLLILFSTFSHSITVSDFSQVMQTEANYPEDMKLYFSGLLGSALMFNVKSLDINGKQLFCYPKDKVHQVDEHIQITNWYIETAGDKMRNEYKKMGRNFAEADISEIYALALMAYHSC